MHKHTRGPHTEAGKARSRLNAFKHGLRATDELFLSHLNRRERRAFSNFQESLHREYKPCTTQEKLIVDRLAIEHFRLYRLYDLEYIATAHSRNNPLKKESIIPHLDRFSRYDWRLERQVRILHNRLRSLYLARGNFSLTLYSQKE
jgi:hypothetical protein